MTADPNPSVTVTPLPRAVTIMVGIAAAVVVIMGARELAWLIGPVFLALVIVLLVQPLHTWLRHKRVPEGVALVALLVAIFGVLVVLGSIVVLAVGRLVTVLPSYAAEADGLVNDLRDWLLAHGISRETVSALLADLNVQAAIQRLIPLVSGIAGLVMNAIFLFSLMLFLGIDATGALGRMAAIDRVRPRLGAILAIPLTLLVKAVLVDTDPSAAWAIALFGSTRAMRHESEVELKDEISAETGVTSPRSPGGGEIGQSDERDASQPAPDPTSTG